MGVWHVYTDGSARHVSVYREMRHRGGWAFVRVAPDGRRVERSGSVRVRNGTGSERMEVMAVVAALVSIPVPGQSVVVHTDATAVIDWGEKLPRLDDGARILRSWLHRKLRDLLGRHAVRFVKEGRPGRLHPENHVADRLAKAASIPNMRKPNGGRHYSSRRFARNRWK